MDDQIIQNNLLKPMSRYTGNVGFVKTKSYAIIVKDVNEELQCTFFAQYYCAA